MVNYVVACYSAPVSISALKLIKKVYKLRPFSWCSISFVAFLIPINTKINKINILKCFFYSIGKLILTVRRYN